MNRFLIVMGAIWITITSVWLYIWWEFYFKNEGKK